MAIKKAIWNGVEVEFNKSLNRATSGEILAIRTELITFLRNGVAKDNPIWATKVEELVGVVVLNGADLTQEDEEESAKLVDASSGTDGQEGAEETKGDINPQIPPAQTNGEETQTHNKSDRKSAHGGKNK